MGNLLKRLIGETSAVEATKTGEPKTPLVSREELLALFARDLSKQSKKPQL